MKVLMLLIAFVLMGKPSVGQSDSLIHVAFFGSSVCLGSGDSLNLGYTGRFAKRFNDFKYQFINVSKGGDNTVKIIPRLTEQLYPTNPDYVFIGLSLNNEGLRTAGNVIGKARIMEQFRTGLLRMADSLSNRGIYPVFMNCYPHNLYSPVDYKLVSEMNAIINEWPFPSINLLGSVNDGSGRWITGLWFDDGHPNAAGYEEMSYTLSPSLLEALEKGKKTPSRVWSDKGVLIFSCSTPVFSVKTEKEDCILYYRNDSLFFTANNYTLVLSEARSNEIWDYITISHCYAAGETKIFYNGELSGSVPGNIIPEEIFLGGTVTGATATDSLIIKDWMIHRSALNANEAKDYMKWKMLKSSLDVYIPFHYVEKDSTFYNQAQTMLDMRVTNKNKFIIYENKKNR